MAESGNGGYWTGSGEGSTTIDKRVEAPARHRAEPASQAHHAGGIGFLALTALGVVFGDIGTSPLYAFSIALNATGHAMPTPADVMGVVSLIFWALIADGVGQIRAVGAARRQ